jgi:YidC/Oxa1 family membrane protein insertase
VEKRALLAIALSVGILLAWQLWLAPSPSTPPPTPPSAVTPSGTPAGSTTATPATPDTEASGWAPNPALDVGAGGGAEVTTPLYQVKFDGDGTAATWTLRFRGSKPLVIGGARRTLAVGVIRPGQVRVETVPLRPATSTLTLSNEQPRGILRFSGATADGLRIQESLEFQADSYEITARFHVEGAVGKPVGLALYWTGPMALAGLKPGDPWHTIGEIDHRQMLGRILVDDGPERGLEAFEAPSPALKDPKESPGGPELKDPHPVAAALTGRDSRWAALENDYFIAAVIRGGGELWRVRDRQGAATAAIFPEVSAESGRPWEGTARLYVGPKEWQRLAAAGVGLEGAQARNYGKFLYLLPMWWFCVPLLWVMNFFGTHVPGQNYGVAIILLTVLVKGLFYPLAQKSMRSMKQMQALQPQLNALKSKHRADPQRFQREQMDLFKKYKVNPMGGCLPMVVQIPIFYALYLTLQYSVELQGAPFVLWISDLSKKDPYYVLPILMGVSMLVQQKMTPTVGDPRQARVMMVMPVIFTFMFLEFPTGLVLYWLVNNVLSIAQQYLIDRSMIPGKTVAIEGKAEKDARKA